MHRVELNYEAIFLYCFLLALAGQRYLYVCHPHHVKRWCTVQTARYEYINGNQKVDYLLSGNLKLMTFFEVINRQQLELLINKSPKDMHRIQSLFYR